MPSHCQRFMPAPRSSVGRSGPQAREGNPAAGWAVLLACVAMAQAPARAQEKVGDEHTPASLQIPTASNSQRIEVTGVHYDNGVGTSDAATQGVIRAELLESRPALRPGEILEYVPGLMVTQHSGDGKANQYFLRGFNLDHGTDFATSVDGMPVNMPSNAHGQGYSDLNFLIPELVDHINYRKGPYFADQGDFASAGAADIAYKSQLDEPFAQVTVGGNQYRRGVVAGSGSVGDGGQLLGAAELMTNNGPWTVREGLQRRNGLLKYSHGSAAQGFSAELMAYQADWHSTDQVPLRLIQAGTYNGASFGRYDAIDPTDGGNTSRFSLSGEWHRRGADDATEISAYLMRYKLQLWSNFTYWMEDPEHGDQFSQKDQRTVSGLKARQSWDHVLGPWEARSEIGLQLRHDSARVGLYSTEARKVVTTTRDDDVTETLAGVFAQSEVTLSPWARTVWGLRVDKGFFEVNSRLADAASQANSGSSNASQWSPKMSWIFGPWAKTEFFVNAGKGFHSNDARGTTAHIDPSSGEAVSPVSGLVASRGWELGARTEWIPGLQSSVAWWQLKFDSELVYVGDAGSTEASGSTTRRGMEWGNHWTPNRYVSVDADLAWTHGRYDNGDHIPNSVDKVASASISLQNVGPWRSTLEWRYLGSGALIEDGSVRSIPSSTFNFRLRRDMRDVFHHPVDLTLDIFNLTNRQVWDIQYSYSTQLSNESAPIDDRIVHAGEPRTVRLTARVAF